MKIAISSDNHLDVNQVNVDQALAFQTKWLIDHQVDYYFYAGDLFNNFQETRDYFARLQSRLGSQAKVYYIAGNHDMLNHAPYSLVENLADSAYLHDRFVDLPGTNWRVIGNNGWYDYSLSPLGDQPAKVAQWKKVYWLDSAIVQPGSDQERMATVLNQVNTQLVTQQVGKQVMLLTHFAPAKEALAPTPRFVVSQRQQYFYQMFLEMTGSDKLGQLVEQAGNVRYVFYGHLHGIHPAFTRNGVTYLNQAVGVKNKRMNEWQAADFFQQWSTTLRIIELKKIGTGELPVPFHLQL